MRAIYEDYMAGFRQAAAGLRSGDQLEETVALLTELRGKMVRERAETPQVAQELARAKRRRTLGRGLGEAFADLSEAVSEFLGAGTPESHLSFYSDVIRDIVSIQKRGGDIDSADEYHVTYPGSPRKRAAEVLDQAQVLLLTAWGKFVGAYERVRMQCV
jgi:hypothetical protein